MLSRPPRPRIPIRPAIGYGGGQSIPPVDILWNSTWPYMFCNIIAAFLLILALALIALEIAFVAEQGQVNTANAFNSGVGIWSGLFILLAAIVILVINRVNRVHTWAIASFILSIIAACFAIIAFSVNAYRIQYGVQNKIFSYFNQFKLAAAELAVAVVAFLLCLVFIGRFIFVSIRISRTSKGRQQNRYPIQRT